MNSSDEKWDSCIKKWHHFEENQKIMRMLKKNFGILCHNESVHSQIFHPSCGGCRSDFNSCC